ncbi:hypothetical protein AURDEDRAFT_114625 [Auricularia subglabra TFB-10046 SS5]|nr:hypothetical protein AURDEDRAFT_114625 [Auricularia subglabra TFB-10046 SS5]
MRTSRRALFLPLLTSAAGAAAALAPCRGTCTHEILATRNQAAATVQISGPSHLVSDLTSAADWEMVECPQAWPERSSGTVRLVCTAEDPSTSCNHVTEEGAVNTIVRMPTRCGTGPFARIAAWDVAKDQSIPSSFAAFAANIHAEIIEATLDYNFAAIPVSRGKVSFDVRAAPDAQARKRMNSARDVPLVMRDLEAAHSHLPVATGVQNDLGIPKITMPDISLPTLPSIDLPDLPSITLPDLPDLPSITMPDVHLPTSLPDLPDLPDFPDLDFEGGVEKSGGFHALDFKKNVTLINTSMGCAVGHIHVDADASIKANLDLQMNAGYAFKIAGSLAPPKVEDFALAGVISGKMHATFDIDMFLTADIMFPPLKLFDLGIPGLSIPGIVNLGPQIALQVYTDLMVDLAFQATIPMKWNFERLDFVFPTELAQPNTGKGQESKSTADLKFSVTPGDFQGALGVHVMPKLEFGIDVLSGLASAEAYVGIDVGATLNANGTIYEDFSMDGCQDLFVDAVVKAGVSAGLFSILHAGKFYPIFEKNATLWQHCSKQEDGPAGAIMDNGDGTFTSSSGDLVNANGQLIDEKGNVIPDAEAADIPAPPILDESGKPIPDDQLIIDNGDGTFEDAQGNPVNKDGQRISPSGQIMGCDLDVSQPSVDEDGNVLPALVDEEGNIIPPEEAIYDMGDGTFSNSKCEIVNEEGQLIDQEGNVIDFEPILDETGKEIPAEDIIIDNGDGTFSDAYGNPVDEYGGAIDLDDNGEIIPVALEPAAEDDGTQLPADEVITDDPDFRLYNPEELKKMAEDLINGVFANPPASPAPAPTSAPAEEPAPAPTSAPAEEPVPAPTSAPAEEPVPAPTSAPAEPAPTTEPETPINVPPGPARPPPPEETTPPILSPLPTAAPGNGTCKRKAKRSDPVVPTKRAPRVSRALGSSLVRRAEFGCYSPSIAGAALPPVSPGMLVPFF